MFQVPEVIVVPLVPSVGPTPPPNNVVMPLDKAAQTCCGEIMCTWPSLPPAVRIRCSPLIASVAGPMASDGVTPAMVDGLPALPMPQMKPFLMPRSAFTTPCTGSTIVTLVMTRSGAPAAPVSWLSMPMPSRSVLPPP